MKRIIILTGMICVLMLGMLPLAMAEQNDLFYYTYNIDELNKYLENQSAEDFESGDIGFLEFDRDGIDKYCANRYIAKGGEIDPSKITHGYNEIWGEYDWTIERIIGFLDSQDKAGYLKQLPIKYYHVPMYYNGIRTTIEERIAKHEKGYWAKTNDTYYPTFREFIQKDKLIQRMEKSGLSGFMPIQFIRYRNFHFVIATKENTQYLIYMPVEEIDYDKIYAKAKAFEKFEANFGNYLKKQVMTVEEAKDMLLELEKAFNKSREIYASLPPEERVVANGSLTGNAAETPVNTDTAAETSVNTDTAAETSVNTDTAAETSVNTDTAAETSGNTDAAAEKLADSDAKTSSIPTLDDDEETPGVSVWLWLVPLCVIVISMATLIVICVLKKKKKV